MLQIMLSLYTMESARKQQRKEADVPEEFKPG
jgi:hypothetical protein